MKENKIIYYRADSEQGEAQFVTGKIKEMTAMASGSF